ncbi:MAG: type II toxin-antitoxin system PemK/MazF family toxin [Candidatus Dormibacteria bacterium]
MLRGEVRLVNLEPVRGAGADKRRPAVVVSNDGANASASQMGRGVVTVVPMTSNIRRVHPFQVLLPARATGLRHDSKAQAEQVRSVAVQRLGPRVGSLPPAIMEKLDEALRLHLAL